MGGATTSGGKVEPPAHPARVGLGLAAAGLDEVEALEQLIGALARAQLREVVEAAHHLQVLVAREVLVDRRVLPREPDARPDPLGVLHDVEPVHLRPPGVGLEERGEDPHRRGLARAVGAEQAEDGALLGLEVESAQGVRVPEALLEALGAYGDPGHGQASMMVLR